MNLDLLQTMPLARILKTPLELTHDMCGKPYVRVKDSNWLKLNNLAIHALQLQRNQNPDYSHPLEQMAARYVLLKIENLYIRSDTLLEKNECFLTRWLVKFCNYCSRCFKIPLIRDEVEYHASIYFSLSPQAAVRDNFSSLHPSKKQDSMRLDWLLYDNENVCNIMEECL